MIPAEDAVMEISRHQREERLYAFPDLVIPADTPTHAAAWLHGLDVQIAAYTARQGEAITDERRIAGAALLLARSTGDSRTAFFAFHYIRLFEEQAEARAAGKPLPKQNWVQP